MGGLLLNVGSFTRRGAAKRKPVIPSSLQVIEPSILLDFNFAHELTYNGAGQYITDLVQGLLATFGANASAGADDPAIVGAGTSAGKATFDGGDFFLEEGALEKRLFDKGTHSFAAFTVMFKTPAAFSVSSDIIATRHTGNTNGWRLQVLQTSGIMRFIHYGGATAGTHNIGTLTANTVYTLTLLADLVAGRLYYALNGAAVGASLTTGMAFTFTAQTANDTALYLGGAQGNPAQAGYEIMRAAVYKTAGIWSAAHFAEIHAQLVEDHAPFF